MWGMSEIEFYSYVAGDMKYSLPSEYKNMSVSLGKTYEVNDVELNALNVTDESSYVLPAIYLDDYYLAYSMGGEDIDTITEMIAGRIVSYENSELRISRNEIMDYETVKDRLSILLCDPDRNEEYLKGKAYSREGDFAAVYRLAVAEDRGRFECVPVTQELMERWGVDMDTLRRDAVLSEDRRKPLLAEMVNILYYSSFGLPVENLLDDTKERAKTADLLKMPLSLTNKGLKNGAALILDNKVLDRVGEVLGRDFYVLPSSVHEVAIVPDSGEYDLQELKETVSHINANDVKAVDVLSDKIQHYDCTEHILENADVWKQRMEKQKDKVLVSDPICRPSVLGKLHQAQERVSSRQQSKPETAVSKGIEL